MSEPKAAATRIRRVAPGLFHWSVHDDRIGSRSEAYAVALAGGGMVLVDPLPLAERALRALGDVRAIVLTIQSHQRSAWRYRRRYGAKVHAPARSEGLEEEPDVWYEHGALLPGGLRAMHAPGPCEASYALVLRRGARSRVAFIGDLLSRGRAGALSFVPDEYQDDPARTRESVRKLAARPITAICPGHGAPIPAGGRAALVTALDRDAARR